MKSRIIAFAVVTMSMWLACGCGFGSSSESSSTPLVTGSFGPVSAVETHDMVDLVGLKNHDILVVMVSVDFSRVAHKGLVPDKRAKVNTDSNHGSSGSELTVRWSFADLGDVIVRVAVGSSGGRRTITVDGRDYESLSPLLVTLRVQEDLSLEHVGTFTVSSNLKPVGFDNLREIYKTSVGR